MSKNTKKPICKLIDKNGNIFYILGQASKVLKSNDMEIEAKELLKRAMDSSSYDEALRIVMKYVEIQ